MTDDEIITLWRKHQEVLSFSRAFEKHVREECAQIADTAEPWSSADLIRCPPCNQKCEQGRKCPNVPQGEEGLIWEVLAAVAFFGAILLACFL